MKVVSVRRLGFILAVCASALGAAPIELRLWPGKAPGSGVWERQNGRQGRWSRDMMMLRGNALSEIRRLAISVTDGNVTPVRRTREQSEYDVPTKHDLRKPTVKSLP